MIQLVKRSPGYVLYLIGAVVTLCLSTSLAVAQTPVVDAVLPVLRVEDKGELVLENDEFRYVPWSSENKPCSGSWESPEPDC